MPIANPSTGNLGDVRQLKAVIDNLQKRLTKLEQSALPFTIQQRGPVPGTMRAIQIGDIALKGSMWISLAGQQPGQAPYQAVTDLGNIIRAEWGNLAANGASPAQYGFRANDSLGAPIFDSQQGIIQPVLVNIIDNAGGTITGNPAGVYTVKSQSFTLNRPATVLGNGLLNAYVSDSGGVLALAANTFIQTDGATSSGKGEVPIFINSGAGNPVSVSPTQVLALAAGTYTAKLLWDTLTTTTQTLHWQSAALLVVKISG